MLGRATAFLDVFLNGLMIFLMLFVISFVQIAPKIKKQADIMKPPVKMLIDMSWSKDKDVDVDLWLQGPNGELVYFGAKEHNFITLDRDDTGVDTDVVHMSEGRPAIVYDHNIETMTIREFVDGNYVIAVHLYNPRGLDENIETSVRVQLLHPNVKLVLDRKVILNEIHREVTIITFTILGGKIIDRHQERNEIVMDALVSDMDH